MSEVQCPVCESTNVEVQEVPTRERTVNETAASTVTKVVCLNPDCKGKRSRYGRSVMQ